MKTLKILFLVLFSVTIYGQKIPSKKVLKVSEISNFLTDDVKNQLSEKGKISTQKLAQYFREKFSERYFYDYKTVDTRFDEYANLYQDKKESHTSRGLDHLGKFPSNPKWKLPFNYQNGQPVNAYALRHLARQHKMVDIAFYYLYQNKDTKYIDYFTEQMQSLNVALHQNKFEIIEDGNGVYEAFRSGYRVLNWLQIHNLFLGEKAYSDSAQLTTIATLLQHASYLYERNLKFKSGNHQTRGLSALAMVSILLRDFVDTDVWYKHSMKLLAEHLRKEINEDGFQFERTVHYHISDIGNYFYVYQLAKNSHLKVDDFWKNKLESLFTTLTKIGFPDKSAPVFSDDTDSPWAEKNDISDALTLGYLLFENPTFGYFANNKVSPKMYWYASQKQLEGLKNIQQEEPSIKSYSFDKTGYFIMREGWKKSDKVLIISAGLDSLKPDHQHGDLLGIQAFANENVILPNYQVRYSLKDLELFKNSMTKNVALVDDELQGKKYTSNKGGSGFGKFKQLPNPKVIGFQKNKDIEIFKELSQENALNIRVNAMLYLPSPQWQQGLAKGQYRSKDDMFTFNSVKIQADGALGSRGAALIDDYSDHPGHRGLLLNTPAAFENLVATSMKQGFQVNSHAIGDHANQLVLDTYEKHIKASKTQALRHRVEHAQVLRLSDIPRFAELDIIASMQATHATSDKNMAQDRLGPDRILGAYAWRKLLNAKAIIAAGSDFPVESPNPFFGLHASITRQDHQNSPQGGWFSKEKMTPLEAFRSFTLDAAYSGHQENLIGSLAAGKKADFVLIDENMFTLPEQDIWKISVDKTWVNGKLVYKKAQ